MTSNKTKLNELSILIKKIIKEEKGLNQKRVIKESKSNIKTMWKTMDDLEGDLQDWLSTMSPDQVQQVLNTLQNFVDYYEGEMDNLDDF